MRARAVRGERSAAGITLVEVMLVVAVIGVIAARAEPHFRIALEQMRVDAAAAGLRSLWVAERMWWLEAREFSDSAAELAERRLLDAAATGQATPFAFALLDADAEGFTARMQRTGSLDWTGALFIDESGEITGSSHDAEGRHVYPQAD
jgi:Tfp pilus assembly protein PilE